LLQHDRSTSPPHSDLDRVQTILDGSTTAWQLLVEEYAGIAISMAMQKLNDQDAARDVVVDVFERLYRGQLATYNGEASLQTWFLLVVHTTLVDQLRRTNGRSRLPAPIERRSHRDRRIFELFFVKGWPSQVVMSQVRAEGIGLDRDCFWDLIEDMDDQLNQRSRRRLRFEREARREGWSSGRWLEYVEHHRHEVAVAQLPEPVAAQDLAGDAAQKVQRELARLTTQEQRVLALRYQDRLTAREIADELELTGPRQAFTLLDRATRRLRQALAIPSEMIGDTAVRLEGKP